MKLRVGILALACGLVFASAGFAVIIPVNNPSFEILPSGGLPILGNLGGDYSVAPIPGWVNSGTSGQFQPGTVPNGYFNNLSDGPTVAYTNGGTISQTVAATVQVDVIYTLQVDIGARLDTSLNAFEGVADLLINGNRYFAAGTENFGGFATYTATYTGLAADAGDPITIELSASSNQGDFDNVRLSDSLAVTPGAGRSPVVIFGTGYVASGPGLAGVGTVDGNFTLISCPAGECVSNGRGGYDAFVTLTNQYPFPTYWLADTSSGQWIGPASGGNEATMDALGVYDYRETFDLTGFNAATVALNGSFAADNTAYIQLNGATAGPTTSSFSSLTPFSLTSGFVSGINTIDFIVMNTPGNGLNPTGLIVELSGTGTPAAAQLPQTITFGSPSNVTLGIAPFPILATANSGLPVTFASTTPAVCTVSGSIVTILAAGTCSITASEPGSANYAAGAPVTQSFTVTVSQGPLQIPGGATPVTLTGGTVAIPYSQLLPSSNGNPPYSWSVLGGGLPKGLSLSNSGTLSGTPGQAGTVEFTGKVTDTAGASASSVFAITIAPQSLTITTSSPLPNGIVGSDYPAQILTATGGNAPYTFQITGALPGGFKFSGGQISGVPVTAGNFPFTVTATDSSSPPLTASAPLQLTIQAAHADLILSQGSLAFSLNLGATGLPSGANISVRSSVASQLLNYSVGVTPAVPWLDVTGGGSTPGAIGINLDPKALSLPSGLSQTSIVVTCVAPSPCAGNSQTINVSLTVSAAPPQLAVTTSLLSFSTQTANPQPVSEILSLQNVGGGTITVNSITAADNFITIAGAPSTIAAGPAIPVTVTANPVGKAAGFYQSTIFVNTSAGSVSVPVTLLIAQNPTMTLNPAGTQFQQASGSTPGNPNGSFLVSVSGNSTISWNAALLPGASWLTLNTFTGTSTSANPGTVSFSINATAATLAPQAYYGAIQVTSNSVVDSPLTFLVILNVAPAANLAQPDPTPAGLLFISSVAGAPAPQIVQVFTSSQTPVTYQTSSDSTWLLVSPASGSTSTASPGSSSVSVKLSGLASGVYRGNVSYALSSAAVRTVNVTLIVEAGAGASDRTSKAVTCAPTQLVPTQTGLVNNFAQPTAWPTPLAVLLVNDCGNPVTNAQVGVTFNNGDPPLALAATDTTSGIYLATWTPGNISPDLAIIARATAAGFPAATVQIVGQVAPNAAPLLAPNGTLNTYSIAPVAGAPLAPGTIVQIYGSNLAAQVTPASTLPLPTDLNRTSVIIGGMTAPLYYVSPGQINAQVPFELPAGNPYQVIVSANGALSNSIPIQLTADAPGIAQYATGEIIAQHQRDYSLILETSPAAPGEVIVFYLAGMGLTNPGVTSGTASPSTNLPVLLDTPTLTLNGAPVTNILFAGLTPTVVGLYQVDFQVPANAPNGDLELVLTQTSGLTTSTILPVHN